MSGSPRKKANKKLAFFLVSACCEGSNVVFELEKTFGEANEQMGFRPLSCPVCYPPVAIKDGCEIYFFIILTSAHE